MECRIGSAQMEINKCKYLHLKKEKGAQISNLIFHRERVEKYGKMKPKANRWKEIIKIWVDF